MQEVEIATADGLCPAYVHRPMGEGRWPAVLMFMDGAGVRPAMQAVAERLAGAGFYVLLPDLFYRSGPYAPVDVAKVWTDKTLREAHGDGIWSRRRPRV